MSSASVTSAGAGAARRPAAPPPPSFGAVRRLERVEDFRAELDAARAAGRTVGLVPTMGYLHDGHASLVRRGASECDVAAVTVFVNPLQFAPGEDFATYPRDLARDAAVAARAGADLVFAPPVDEMYPRPLATTVSVGGLSEPLEGAVRPGHLTGVATVVAKLLVIAGPCRAYFGEKDYQQLLVVERMVRDLSLPVEVVRCATVRHADGLALSSRNEYLSHAERRVAPVLHRALLAGAALVASGERDPAAVRRRVVEVVSAEPRLALDYAEVVSADDLRPLSRLVGDVRILVAARLGRARLIDNVGATVPSAADDER